MFVYFSDYLENIILCYFEFKVVIENLYMIIDRFEF